MNMSVGHLLPGRASNVNPHWTPPLFSSHPCCISECVSDFYGPVAGAGAGLGHIMIGTDLRPVERVSHSILLSVAAIHLCGQPAGVPWQTAKA
jgi:hypothetical protein